MPRTFHSGKGEVQVEVEWAWSTFQSKAPMAQNYLKGAHAEHKQGRSKMVLVQLKLFSDIALAAVLSIVHEREKGCCINSKQAEEEAAATARG